MSSQEDISGKDKDAESVLNVEGERKLFFFSKVKCKAVNAWRSPGLDRHKSSAVAMLLMFFVWFYVYKFIQDRSLEVVADFLEYTAFLVAVYCCFFRKLSPVPGEGKRDVEKHGVIFFGVKSLYEGVKEIKYALIILFSSICLQYVGGLSQSEIQVLGDSKLIPVLTALLAPLAAWVGICVKKILR